METIDYKGNIYPKFQSQGFAAQFAFPFAKHLCKGTGYDIGCNRPEWCLPEAIPVDPLLTPEYDAYNLPNIKVDYIFSSHCLEHLRNWVEALDYWRTKLHDGGTLFLYLPDYSQVYWRSWNNTKHVHNLTPQMLRDYLTDRQFKNIFVSGVDLNNSFYAVAEK